MVSYHHLATSFFDSIVTEFDFRENHLYNLGLLTHILPGRDSMIKAMASVFHVKMVMAKPRSIHEATRKIIEDLGFPVIVANREYCQRSEFEQYLSSNLPWILCDIGGYFTRFACQKTDVLIRGIIEDTQNGHHRYARLKPLLYPVVSVAQSPLKDAEDYQVGKSITFSIESALRQNSCLINTRKALVLGFGKVGQSIAQDLQRKGLCVSVIDIDPIRQICAHTVGFGGSVDYRTKLLQEADLIVGATGNKSITTDDLIYLKPGVVIATATSADDELNLSMACLGVPTDLGYGVTRYYHEGKSLYLLNDGHTVNFLHDGEVGPYILLVQAEIMVAINALMNNTPKPGLSSVSQSDRMKIAECWLKVFN